MRNDFTSRRASSRRGCRRTACRTGCSDRGPCERRTSTLARSDCGCGCARSRHCGTMDNFDLLAPRKSKAAGRRVKRLGSVGFAMARVLVPLPDADFDTTEVAVPWRLLTRAGHEVVFATEQGGRAPACDPRLLSGVIFGKLGAEPEAKAFYAELERAPELNRPI